MDGLAEALTLATSFSDVVGCLKMVVNLSSEPCKPADRKERLDMIAVMSIECVARVSVKQGEMSCSPSS